MHTCFILDHTWIIYFITHTTTWSTSPYIAFCLSNTIGKTIGNVVNICLWDQIDIVVTILWLITMVITLVFYFHGRIMYTDFVHITCICTRLFFTRVAHTFQTSHFLCILWLSCQLSSISSVIFVPSIMSSITIL